MSGIQPRTLSNKELIRYCADLIGDEDGMPKHWQVELLRRFTALAPDHAYPVTDEKQLGLFK